MILSTDYQPSDSNPESGSDAEVPSLESQVGEVFGPGGLLSQASNFEYRQPQQAMATGVIRALEAGKNCVVEAGTGVGKSLAYLIPAILFGHAHHRKARRARGHARAAATRMARKKFGLTHSASSATGQAQRATGTMSSVPCHLVHAERCCGSPWTSLL